MKLRLFLFVLKELFGFWLQQRFNISAVSIFHFNDPEGLIMVENERPSLERQNLLLAAPDVLHSFFYITIFNFN